MGFSLANGLSAMGSSVAATAGTAALEDQKADLDNQKEQLINNLTTQRETTLETQRETGASALSAQGAQQASALATQQEIAQSADVAKQIASQEKISAGQQSTSLKVAGIEAGTARAQIAAGAVETGFDSNQNTVIYNKLTGSSAVLKAPDGSPLRLTSPAQAMLARDLVNSTNEQVRAATQQYHTTIVAAQKDTADALKAANGAEDDKDVIAARAREADATQQYTQTIATLNHTVNAQVNAALHLAPPPAPGGANGNAPPLSSIFGGSASGTSSPVTGSVTGAPNLSNLSTGSLINSTGK